MSLFGNLFKKKEDENFDLNIPVDEVLELKSRGLSNDQIVKYLQSKGYTMSQIRDALMQISLQEPATEPMPTPNQPEPTPVSPAPQPQPKSNIEEIERILEEIVRDETEKINQRIEEVEKWKVKIESRIEDLEGQIKDLNKRIDDLVASVMKKIEEHDRHFESVESGVQAMEMLFKKFVPELSASVKELKAIIDEQKKKSLQE